MRKRKIIWFIALILFIATGCLGRKSVLQKYYLLELPAIDSTSTNPQPVTEASCKIAPVEINPAFASSRIAVRTRTHEINYYAHHKWAIQPGETFTRFIEDYFQTHAIFAVASSRTWEIVADYELRTQIKQLEVVEDNDKLSAHLTLEFQMVDNSSMITLLVHKSEKITPLRERDLNLFASTISQSFFDELQLFSDKIISYLQSQSTEETSKL